MYIKKLTVTGKDQIAINFPTLVEAGTPVERMPWTVLIGKNGSGKTKLLKRIASAVEGHYGRSGTAQPEVNAEMDPTSDEGFVVAYGAHRALPDLTNPPYQEGPTSSLLGGNQSLCGLGFLSRSQKESRGRFLKIINMVLSSGLLPDLQKIRLDDIEGGFPTLHLSYGIQAALAWIADMVGYGVSYDGSAEDPAQIRGLVLVDGIDLHLHPTLHVEFIQGLMKTFPRVQFVVTTNSPLMLGAFRTDQDKIVRLERGDDPVEKFGGRDPDVRLMTIAEVYQRYFGLDRVFAGVEGLWAAEWQSMAHNPYRREAEEERLYWLSGKLKSAGVHMCPPTPKKNDDDLPQ